jgi:hypothetical protein
MGLPETSPGAGQFGSGNGTTRTIGIKPFLAALIPRSAATRQAAARIPPQLVKQFHLPHGSWRLSHISRASRFPESSARRVKEPANSSHGTPVR